MYSSLFSCSTIHELSVLHAEECGAMTRNIVKRLANQDSFFVFLFFNELKYTLFGIMFFVLLKKEEKKKK